MTYELAGGWGGTAFGLDGELTHRKHYSSEKSNPLMFHIGHHNQGDQRRFVLLQTLLPALTEVPVTPVRASPHQPCGCLGQALGSEEDIPCGISQPCQASVVTLDYNIR